MKKVLVTGGAGFLGSHVADELSSRGFDVVIFDRQPSAWLRRDQTMVVGDITDASAVMAAMQGVDSVYHLAALADLNAGRDQPMVTYQVNIGGTLNVLEAMRAHGVNRLMFASTVYVYSREGGFYRCSKQASETYIDEYSRHYGIEYTVLRYGSLYGPRADASNGVYRLLSSALNGQTIQHGGSPDDVRQYIHVEDAARLSADAAAAEFANRHIVITGHDSLRVQELFTMFGEILGRSVAVNYAHPNGLPAPGQSGGHYGVTPYAYTPKPGRKLTSSDYVDMGQGLLEVIAQMDREANNQAPRDGDLSSGVGHD